MLKKLLILCLAVSLVLVAFPAAAQEGADDPTLADVVVASAEADEPQFTILLAAIQAADPAVLEALSDPEGDFTVFAPSDEAFENFQDAVGDDEFNEMLADTDMLTSILRYHVLGQRLDAFNVARRDGDALDTLLEDRQLDVDVTDSGDVFINDSMIIETDIEAANGVIHVIDAVLVPLLDFDEDADETDEVTLLEAVEDRAADEEAPELTALYSLVEAADPSIAELLNDPDAEITIFAPNDDAFAALLEALGDEEVTRLTTVDTAELSEILQYHVVDGSYTADDLVALIENQEEQDDLAILLDTLLEDQQINVALDEDGNVFVNEAQVITADIEGINGVIHILDSVLVPSRELAE